MWSFVQDYKYYKAEGGKRPRRWADNTAFRNGAIQGYTQSNPVASLDIEDSIKPAKEIIEIEDDTGSDSDSDSDSSLGHEDVHTPMGIEDWIQKAQENQVSLQYLDRETGEWITQVEAPKEKFLAELRDIAGNLDGNGQEIGGGMLMEDAMDLSPSTLQVENLASHLGFRGLGITTSSVSQDPFAAPTEHHPEESRNLDELCADVMKMHGNEHDTLVQARRDYEFSWTGM